MDKTLDLDELERVAKRATQARRYRVGPKVYARGHGVPLLTVNDLGPSLGQQDEDATYIATFDPPTILTLIAAARPAVVSDEVVERMCRAHDAVRFGSELSAYVDHQGAAMRAALSLLPVRVEGSSLSQPSRTAQEPPSPTPCDLDWSEFEDEISDAISDSLDMDWQSRDGARAVVAYLKQIGAKLP